MDKNLRVFIVDDDPDHIKLLYRYLKSEAETVAHSTSSVDALPKIIEQKPDCVILDIMMPELDGLELCKLLRRERSLDATKIVIVSGKSYQFDRERAFSFGADGYMVKPVNPKEFVDQLRQILEEKIQMTFWGVRGTLPVPGEMALKYGGNTSCVTLEFPRENLFILDAGSGIKVFSDYLMSRQQPRIEAELFISHPHWDHINALPFFAPLYIPGNEFEICGPSHGDTTMLELISGQMGGVYSPIKIKKFASRVYFRNLKEEEFDIHHIRIRTMLLNHPGYCLGYRLEYKTKSVCYVTDNELFPESSQFYSSAYLEKLLAFVEDTDALIIDCTYTEQEYPDRIGWGHSSVGQVVDLADRAGVRTLYLYHHDPGQSDMDIDAKLEVAQLMLKERNSTTLCVSPKERQLVKI